MKRKKSQGGFTLVELTVVIALLAIVGVGITGVILAAHKSYQTNEEKLKDEYNARNALVFITREIHSGPCEATFEDDPDGNTILTLRTFDDNVEPENVLIKEIVFSLGDKGVLQMKVKEAPADYNVALPENRLELESFVAEPSRDKDGNPDGKRVELSIECKHGLKLETSVALLRTQPGGDPPGEADDE